MLYLTAMLLQVHQFLKPLTHSDPLPGTSGTRAPTSDAFTDTPVAEEQGQASASSQTAEPEHPRHIFSRTQVVSDAVLQNQEQILNIKTYFHNFRLIDFCVK